MNTSTQFLRQLTCNKILDGIHLLSVWDWSEVILAAYPNDSGVQYQLLRKANTNNSNHSKKPILSWIPPATEKKLKPSEKLLGYHCYYQVSPHGGSVEIYKQPFLYQKKEKRPKYKTCYCGKKIDPEKRFCFQHSSTLRKLFI